MTRKAIGDRVPIRRGRRIRVFSFEQITGEGAAPAEGSLSGTLTFDATSLTTKKKQRDKHLRTSDFFDTENHPMVVLTVTEATALTIVRWSTRALWRQLGTSSRSSSRGVTRAGVRPQL